MTKEIIPFHAPDISVLAKTLKKDIATNPEISHLELLNSLARGAGFKNFQHFRKDFDESSKVIPEIVQNTDQLKKIIRYFDKSLVLHTWPNKEGLRLLCLWFIWSRIPYDCTYTEIEFNWLLNSLHSYKDPARLRRYLVSYDFVTRSADCSDYRRLKREIPNEILPIINMRPDDIPEKPDREQLKRDHLALQ